MAAIFSQKPVFTIRFIGGELERKNLPIYELGMIFMSIQRLFNKAYLVENGKFDSHAGLRKEERQQLALQVGVHEKRSDFYGLIPFLTDPQAISAMYSLAEFVAQGIASYSFENLLEKITNNDNQKQAIYIGAIHAEVVTIVDRIDGRNGCEMIQIGCPSLPASRPIELTEETRKYVKRVYGEHYLGRLQKLKGIVYKLYPDRSMLEIRRGGGKKCKLFLTENDFNSIRYGKQKSPTIAVIGRPRFEVGTETPSFDEFEVLSIDSIA